MARPVASFWEEFIFPKMETNSPLVDASSLGLSSHKPRAGEMTRVPLPKKRASQAFPRRENCRPMESRTKSPWWRFVVVLAIVLAVDARAEPVDFNSEIRPILSNKCYRCHGPDDKERKGQHGFRLDRAEGAAVDLGEGRKAVAPGKPEASDLIRRVESSDPDEQMPPPKSGKRLEKGEVDLLKRWIEQGAKFARHWSYEKPVKAAFPEADVAWPSWQGPIDRFLLGRLRKEGLRPSAEGDRHALARRMSLDLTGLPPAWEDVERFVADPSQDAYEKFVDQLLKSEAYGEHWARQWLDLARYADSAGYADDPPRTIWGYRDYVIRAFNANKPFDQFTLEQIAGDLLPNPSEEQLIATAFHRNTMTNNEGGTNDEEFRNVAVVDRVNTTLAVWMGTTMACAQCHTHKFDPISQEEYFRMFAFFNNSQDADRTDESPTIGLESSEQRLRKEHLETEIAELKRQNAAMPLPATRDRLAVVEKQLAEHLRNHSVPVMRELEPKNRRKTHLQYRGNFMDLGKEVTEGVPAAWHPLAEGAPADRLALAKWLVARDNPLTARVVVNRYWETIFGLGIVRTSEEFGSQGELPTHPELLDWLAVDLMENGWDLKRLLRQLVTSAAYRQTSRVDSALQERDPDNRLLARGPRFRLSAEMVRDQALAVSGLLSRKMHGPPVKPRQPALGLSAAFGSGVDWKTSDGEDQYRRGLYTTWRRSNPYPSMAAFDAPNREVCTVRRDRTNTPLQALVTLNDPVYLEAAQALARKMAATSGDASAKARHGFQLCAARPPSDAELMRLTELHERSRLRFAADPARAEQMATKPLGPAPKGSDLADLAAWSVVANVLLNLDEILMKR